MELCKRVGRGVHFPSCLGIFLQDVVYSTWDEFHRQKSLLIIQFLCEMSLKEGVHVQERKKIISCIYWRCLFRLCDLLLLNAVSHQLSPSCSQEAEIALEKNGAGQSYSNKVDNLISFQQYSEGMGQLIISEQQEELPHTVLLLAAFKRNQRGTLVLFY